MLSLVKTVNLLKLHYHTHPKYFTHTRLFINILPYEFSNMLCCILLNRAITASTHNYKNNNNDKHLTFDDFQATRKNNFFWDFNCISDKRFPSFFSFFLFLPHLCMRTLRENKNRPYVGA